jgi:DNA-binding transcriptional regulator LsrR (DeoR family)
MVIVGVGTPYDPAGGLQRSGYINEMDLTELKQAGAVGDIVGFHLNEQGAIVDTPLNSRVVGILPDDLRAVAHVVVVAHGLKKVAPLLAALRGKYVNVVVTDASTASAILNAL